MEDEAFETLAETLTCFPRTNILIPSTVLLCTCTSVTVATTVLHGLTITQIEHENPGCVTYWTALGNPS